MIKKFSLFFSTSVRQRMEDGREFRNSPGMQSAMELVHWVMLVCTVRPAAGVYQPRNDWGRLNKWFNRVSCRQEGDELERNADRARRVEVTIAPGIGDSRELRILLEFFDKGQGSSFAGEQVRFNLDTGCCCGLQADSRENSSPPLVEQ